jgi:hypothetical protein
MKRHFGHSADHAIQGSYDPDKDALKVSVLPHEVNFSLNKESDSIVSHSACKSFNLKADELCNVYGTSQISIYGEPNNSVSVSPDGNEFFNIGLIPENGVLTIKICAFSLKCSNACKVVSI